MIFAIFRALSRAVRRDGTEGLVSFSAAALPIFAILVGLALSTYAQCLFSLDSASGMTRYRLMPLRPWRILLAKDAAFPGVLLVLVLRLDAGAGMTFGVTALAIGHRPSVTQRLPLKRWRFAGGAREIRRGAGGAGDGAGDG